MISATILENPIKKNDKISKGVIILSDVDKVVGIIPRIKEYFYLIERKGWEGMNKSKHADIKLVEDPKTLDETKSKFPNAIILGLAGGDFVDTDKFKPLDVKKEYCGIQISSWQRFKRPNLFVEGVSLLKSKKFLKFGHFPEGGSEEENNLKEDIIKLSKKKGANINFIFSDLINNNGLPSKSEDVNLLINKCKMGILTTKVEGLNRFKMECLASNIPVLVPKDASEPTRKYINRKTGILFEPNPEGLAKAIVYVEKNYNQFRPREFLLEHTGIKKSLQKLRNALRELSNRDKTNNNFRDVFWDGRNQSMVWGENAIKKIKNIIRRVKLNI